MKKRNSLGSAFLNFVFLPALALIVLFPIIWMIAVSIKPEGETYTTPLQWIPMHPTLEHYIAMWKALDFKTYFLNTFIVAACTTILAISFSAPAAYGFVRFRFRGHGPLGTFLLSTQMFPRVILIVPYFITMRYLGLINTYTALILIYISFAMPFCVWSLRGYFMKIPREIDEAAFIDGCGPVGAFARVVLPLSLPGVVATAIFGFIVGWNEFLFAMILTTERNMFVITVGLASLIGEFKTHWNELMAAAVVASLPAMVLYAFLERYLVGGLVAGAKKG